MDYSVGENFDHTGMTLRVTYDNGTQEVISSAATARLKKRFIKAQKFFQIYEL